MRYLREASLAALLFTSAVAAAAERERPVAALAGHVYTLHTQEGEASFPIELSADLGAAHPEISRAALVFHGKGRDVEGYFRALEHAAADAGPNARQTILLAPQFLRAEDAEAHHLPERFLRWHAGSWTAGEPASGPVPLSSFDVIDALLVALGDRGRFPNLNTIVLIGHSGGGQLLNRYAIVSAEPAARMKQGIHVRFVIANPSSYFYFNDDRPRADRSLAAFDGARCPNFNHWRYGPLHAPPYVGDTSAAAWQKREADYARGDVIYLLGSADTDPAQADLDTTCAGEAEGPERLERGKAYFRYLRSRHPQDLRQRLWFVSGVAHAGGRMVSSACAIAAVFDYGNCSSQAPDRAN
jgi:hypothetical protein